MQVGSNKARALRAVTRCATVDEFITGYARFASDDGLFIVTRAPRAPGPPRAFVVQLSDGTVVLRGTAEVVESHAVPTGPDTQCGMRLAFVELDSASHQVHRALLDERTRQIDSAVPAELPVVGVATSTMQGPVPQPRASRSSAPTLALGPIPVPRASVPALPPPPAPPETGGVETLIGAPAVSRPPAPRPAAHTTELDMPRPPPPVEQRTPGSPYILPANPLWELPPEALEHFVECTMYEHTDISSFDALIGDPQTRPPIGYAPYPPAPYPPAAPPWQPPPSRRGLLLVAITATTLGLAGGYALRGDPTPPSLASAPALSATPPAPARCRALLVTDPPGVRVQYAGLDLGTTPLGEIDVPCGPATVVLSHPRRLRTERDVEARPGERLELDVTMPRPAP